jgi:AraC-like DNA-binding protein
VERGSGVRLVGDSAAPFGDGDLVLLGPQVPHSWTSCGPPRGPGEPPRVASVVQWAPALLAQPLLPELVALRPLAERARRGLAVTGAGHAAITQLLAAMRDADVLARLAGLVNILRQLALGGDDLQPVASSPLRAATEGDRRRRADRRIDLVADWTERHLASALRVEDAARVAHVSPAAFSRYFRRETGKTWSAHVNDLRCSEACVRLRPGSQPVATVAADGGYRTMSHFNRAFRMRYGVTPRD